MDVNEVEETFFAAGDAKLHGEMCNALSAIYCRVMSIFPSLEDARPRSKSGIQALCSLHVALEKTKNILKHCTESSKLYLAVTGDSVALKFEKAKSALADSLRRIQDIVQPSIGSQVFEILTELEGTEFSLDPMEKEVGDQIIALLQQGGKFESSTDSNELEIFHQVATRLGITSSRAALTERRCLKKLIDRVRMEDDKRKESIVAYLLHLMRKYSKLFRSEVCDDNDSGGSLPCSPTLEGSLEDGHGRAFDRQLSKLSSFNIRSYNNRRSVHMSIPPELRCPISLQLMYDPVIIASGQTFERICIEKWFSDGHTTCPKTREQLSHLCLTPNYCVKALTASWCEQNGVPVLDGPPESLDLNYWRLALSVSESNNSRSVNGDGFRKLKEVKVVPLEESRTIQEESCESEQQGTEITLYESCIDLLTTLNEEENLRKKCRVVEQIRLLLKDDEEARILMGENGCVEALLHFLGSALCKKYASAQEIGAMALFNLAVNNNRNKELMLTSGITSLLEKMLSNMHCHGSATALYLNLSGLEDAKPVIGSSQAVPFLVNLLQTETNPQCKADSLHALYNVSTYPPNIPLLLFAGIVNALESLTINDEQRWTEKSLAVLLNLVSVEAGKDEMVLRPGLVSNLATVLDTGEPSEQEQAVSLLLILCNHSENCSQMVLQEGVIPSLVSISVNGTQRGRERAQKLLTLFREQRHRDQTRLTDQHSQVRSPENVYSDAAAAITESKPQCKSMSKRKMGRAFGFLWKSKSFSVYQC